MCDLYFVYFKVGVFNQDVFQDYVFFVILYNFVMVNGICVIFLGGNFVIEVVFFKSWYGLVMDVINLKVIYFWFGLCLLKIYLMISFMKYYFWYLFFKKMWMVWFLNYMFYEKVVVIQEMMQ